MNILLALLAWLLPPSSFDVAAFSSTAPENLTADTAGEHLQAARLAAAIYNVDPYLVLAIAHHESRYDAKAVTVESGGRVSCGSMTPVPTYDRAACARATSSVLSGYLAGAKHLHGWIHAGDVRSIREAELGYARGYWLIRGCRVGPMLRHGDHGDDLCKTADVFEFRAALIRRAMASWTRT